MTQYVRSRLARTISSSLAKNEGLRILTLRPELEKQIAESMEYTEFDFDSTLAHATQEMLRHQVHRHLEQNKAESGTTVLVVGEYIRPVIARLFKTNLLGITVLTGSEISPETQILSHHQLDHKSGREALAASRATNFSTPPSYSTSGRQNFS